MGNLLEKLSFVFLHGFLGQPSDWDLIIQNLRTEFPQYNYLSVDYFNSPPLSPKMDLKKWSENFVDFLGAEFGNFPVVLVGYSLGGRLALQALKNFPDRFPFIFLVSTNPGFLATEVDERKHRLQEDQKWSQRFLDDDWKSLIKDWNAQQVFQGSIEEPERVSSNYKRDLLSKAIIKWSVANQEDLRSLLITHQKKITWIVGDLDKKYIQLTKEIFKVCPDMNYSICPNSSHRVLIDNPTELSRSINRILKKVLNKPT